jgi:uncharacterized protein YndB with AHSA1/START domain
MTYELKLERQFDAPPEVVFDTFVDKTSQGVLHGAEQRGWDVEVVQTDVRVGGTSIVRMGSEGREPDTETRVYSVVDRPHRLELRYSMALAETGLTLDTEMTITFEERDGGTWFTMVETGFEVEADRDGFVEGWTEYLETLGKVLKTRHDT